MLHFWSCSAAQLPKECTTEGYNKTCCPVNDAGQCSGRGTCISVNENDPWLTHCSVQNAIQPCPDGNSMPINRYCDNLQFLRKRPMTNKTDFRYNWPAQIFTHICKCSGNYAGYDCSRCKPGYTGSNCEQKRNLIKRKNFLMLSTQEKNAVFDALKRAKNELSGYTVPIKEPPQSASDFKRLPLYDVFATFHYYTARDEDFYDIHSNDSISNESISNESRLSLPDFGHEGPGFLPWHRAYLLYFETEMQYLLGDPSFALPYWDWTKQDPNASIFQDDLFGSTNICINKSCPKDIVSEHFGNWKAVCTDTIYLTMTQKLCNPCVHANELDECTDPEKSISRCVGVDFDSENENCAPEYSNPPVARDVEIALEKTVYDECGYDKLRTTTGFRNTLEGFFDFKTPDSNAECDFAGLHNLVHRYIGGTMGKVPTASNDPIFWLHHSNIDRIYEQWLNRTNVAPFKPESLDYRVSYGHNPDDYLGLLFPPITNIEAHKLAREFGYMYEEESSPSRDGNGADDNGADDDGGDDSRADDDGGDDSRADDDGGNDNGDDRDNDDGGDRDGNGNDRDNDRNDPSDDGNRNGGDRRGGGRDSSDAVNTKFCGTHLMILLALYAAMLVW